MNNAFEEIHSRPFRILNRMVILLYSGLLIPSSLPRKTCSPDFVCGKPVNDLV